MTSEKRNFFLKSEDMLKAAIHKFKSDGESETVAIELALQALENMYKENGLKYDGYKEILKDLETIYTNPVETYRVYQKYGIFGKEV